MSDEGREYSLAYYQRRLKANKIRRLISARRRQIRLLRVLIRLCLIAAAIYLGITILKLPNWHISHVKLLNNTEEVVKIYGNDITPTHKIIDMIRQSELKDVGIYRLKTKNLEENIKKLEPVKNVYIRRFWLPARILIVLEEREPKFLISPDIESEPVSIVTGDGVFIGREYMPLNKKYRAIKVLGYETGNNEYNMWDQKRVDEIDRIIKIAETYSNQNVQYLDLRNPRDIYIQLDEVLLRIGAIDDTTEKRLEFLVTIMPQLTEFRQRTKYIDLRWAESAYIKLKSNQNN